MTNPSDITHQDVLNFWFEELSAEDWFKKSDELDQIITAKFATTLNKAKAGELFEWRSTAKGRLAEIIVLDQFSRNIHRDTPLAFSADSLALILAQEALLHEYDRQLTNQEKAFLYMPFMHSESKAIHKIAEKLFNQDGLEHNYTFELEHKKIIDKFGRYPHRNNILKRESTQQELEFLKQHNGF
ncbi:DUF924 family protein [Flocculibacter collagenilyticus]|uniref:DUF924 family protein n=1 Tax=Flocculibacter collagenilyticus TaxID=2744479 RepID=UPI0018F293A6|nr:DUF924 family protein [Flocculibacter collagenilyticus]